MQHKKEAKERRLQPRTPTRLPIRVKPQGSSDSIGAVARNLSWGGVLFDVTRADLPADLQVSIEFPWKNGETFQADGKIIRLDASEDDRIVAAARIVTLPLDSQPRFEQMLWRMFKGKQAATEPAVKQLDVECGDVGEMLALLRQVAHGAIWLTGCVLYQTGEGVAIQLSGLPATPTIHLRARVLQVLPVKIEGRANGLVKVFFGFEHHPDELKAFAWGLHRQLTLSRHKGPMLGLE